MRFVYLLILVLVIGAVGVFVVQNDETVTLRYFNQSVATPLSLLIAAVYILGMVSGWTVVGFLRRSLNRVTEHSHR